MSSAVTIPADIGGRTFKLVFKFGTIRLAERELPATLGETFRDGKVSLDALSAVFWATLQPAHAMTRDASDDLVDLAGIEAVSNWVSDGVSRYFGSDEADPAASAGKSEGNAQAPRKKRRAS